MILYQDILFIYIQIIYGLNIATGKKDYYLYDEENKTFTKYDDEYLSYYINFLKSLSMRINCETIQFFFDGYTQPFYLKFSDLNKTKDPNQSLYEALKELAKRS